jgi:hypothetical protein
LVQTTTVKESTKALVGFPSCGSIHHGILKRTLRSALTAAPCVVAALSCFCGTIKVLLLDVQVAAKTTFFEEAFKMFSLNDTGEAT